MGETRFYGWTVVAHHISLAETEQILTLRWANSWTFDFLDLVLLGFVKSMVAEDLGITERDEAWMLGVSLGTSGLGALTFKASVACRCSDDRLVIGRR